MRVLSASPDLLSFKINNIKIKQMLHGILWRIFTLGLSYLGLKHLKTEGRNAAVISATATESDKTTDDGTMADTNGN